MGVPVIDMTIYRVAVVQHPPVYLNRAATLERATRLVSEAASNGATLVAFPESFVPSYPDHVGRLRPAKDVALVEALYARMLANAVNLEADDLRPLRQAARECAVTVVCGITERDAVFSRSTMYNAVIVIGPDGT